MRITIDGQEVVCSNDFTIKQEMLNTPSVILNNVYPKSWETDKDYTTNFYHPEDYSQCLIYDQSPLLPNEYKEVEYIESSGTQYIDTGFQPNQDTRILIDLIQKNTSTAFILGARDSYASNNYGLLKTTATNFRSDYGNGADIGLGGANTSDKFTIDKNKNITTVYKNGATISTGSLT